MNEIGKVSIKLIADTDSFFKDIKKAVASISKIKNAEIKITADTSQLKKSISSSISEISKIKNANILIGSDITKLTKGVDVAKSQIDQISKTSASIPLNVDNVKALDKVQQTEARLKILQQRANEITINPNVKTSALQGLELQIASTKNRLDTLNPSFLSSAFSGLGNTANSALSSIRSGLEQTSSVARNLALGVTAGLAGAFLIAGKNAIDYGGQLQQARGDLTVLLGSEEKALQVLKEQQRFAGQTPFETGDLIKSANVLSTVINNVDELNLRTKQLGEASGGIPANLARISNTYSQVVSKGKVDTVDLKEFINAGFASVRIEAQKELGVTGEAFEDAVSRGAITADVLNRILNRVTEGYPRLGTASKTLTGVFSTASDTIKNFGLSLVGIDTTTFELKTGGIADAISKLVTQFNTEGVVASLAKFGEKIGSTVASLFSGIDFGKVDLAGIVDSISSGFDNVITKVIEFGGLIKSAFDEIVKSAGGLDNLVRILTIVAGVLGTVGAASILLNPVTLIIGGITAGVVLLAKAIGNGDIVKGTKMIQDGMMQAFQAVPGILKGVFEAFKNIGKGMDFVIKAVGGFKNFAVILTVLATTIGAVALAFNAVAIATAIATTTAGVFAAVVAVAFSPITLIIAGIAIALTGLAAILGGGDLTKGFSKIWDGIVVGGKFAVELIKGYWTGIMEIFKFATETLLNIYVRPFASVIGFIFPQLGTVLNDWGLTFSQNTQKVGESFDTVTKKIDGSLNTTANKVNETTKRMSDDLIAVSNSTGNFAVDSVFAALGSSLGDLSDRMKDSKLSATELQTANEDLLQSFRDLRDDVSDVAESFISVSGAELTLAEKQSKYNEVLKEFAVDSPQAIQAYNDMIGAELRLEKQRNSSLNAIDDLNLKTEELLTKFRATPELISKVELAELASTKAGIDRAIELGKRNGENITSLELLKTRIDLIETSKFTGKTLSVTDNLPQIQNKIAEVNSNKINPKVFEVTAFTGPAFVAMEQVSQKVLPNKTLQILGEATGLNNVASEAIRSISNRTATVKVFGDTSALQSAINRINTTLDIRSVPGQSLGGLIKPFASGGKVQSLLGGGLASLIPKGDDTIAGYKFGEFVSKVPVSRKYGGVLNSMNFETPKFDGFMQNVARMTKAIGAMASSNTTNNTNNLPVNINIANLNQQGTSRAVAGIGFMLQSEMLNRGLL